MAGTMDNHTSNRKLGVEDTWLNGLSGISKIKNFILCDIQNNFSRPFCSLASCFRGGVKAQDPISQTNGFGQYTGLDQNVIINNDQNSANPSSQPQNQINTPARVNLLGGIENTILGVNPSPADISGNLLYGQENGINADDAKITNSVAMGLGNLLQSECEECIALGADNEISGGESTLSFGAFSRNQSERSILIGFGASSTARLQDVGTRSITLGTSNNSSNTAFKTLNIRPPSTAGNFSAPVTGIGITSPDAKLSIENTGGNSSSTILNLRDNNSNKVFTVKNNGNVGIGTPTSPVSKLQIISNGTTNSTFALNVRDANNNSLLLVRDDGWTGFSANPSAPYYFTETSNSPAPFTGGKGKANIVQDLGGFPSINSGNKWISVGERPPDGSNNQIAYGYAATWDNFAGNFFLDDVNQDGTKDLTISFQDAGVTDPDNASNRMRFIARDGNKIFQSGAFNELMSLEPTGEVAVGDYSGSVTPDAQLEVKGDPNDNISTLFEVLEGGSSSSRGNEVLTVNDNGVIGINRTSRSGSNPNKDIDLTVAGNAEKGDGTTDWETFSDRRLKQDIKEFNDGLKVLKKINPITFKYNGKLGLDTSKRSVGVIAQEIKKVAPYMVTKDTGENGYYSYNSNAMRYILVNAVQEQQKQLKEEQSENDSMRQALKKQQKQLKNQQEKLYNQQEQIDQLRERLNRLAQQKEGNANRFKKSDNLNEKTVAISAEDGQKQAMLLQNRPNPYSGETVIPYYLPETFDKANMLITNINGQVIKRIGLENAGKGELTLRTDGLKAGQYFYSLIVDGRKIQTRKMVLKNKR